MRGARAPDPQMSLAAALLVLSTLYPRADPVRIETAHYALEWAGTKPEAEEAGRLLEASFVELATFFSREPKDRMQVRVFADEKSRIEAGWDDGIPMPAHVHHASFSEETRVAYVSRLAGPQATRAGLLYAACLQFHSLSKSKNLDVGRTWQAWGLALDWSRSTWDGAKLVAFADPRVEPFDLPGRALTELGTGERELFDLAAKDAIAPSLAWAITAMCLHGSDRAYRTAFDRYAIGETGTKLSTVDFLRTLGPPAKVTKDLRAYLVATQMPFEPFGDWEDRGAAGIVGHAPGALIAHCVLKNGNGRSSARMSKLPKTGARAGFVAGWSGPDDHARIEIEAPEVLVHVLRLGSVVETKRLAIPGDAQRERVIELERVGNQYTLIVDGTRFAGLELPSGRMGFFAAGADVAFRDVSWR